MSNIVIEEYESGIKKATYYVRNAVLNTPDNEIDVAVVYESQQYRKNDVMRGVETDEFISEYITLRFPSTSGLAFNNKIHIITLSPEDKVFFENPNLNLPKCIEFISDVPLAHTPAIMEIPPSKNFIIKDPMGTKRCEFAIRPKYNEMENKIMFDNDELKKDLKEEMGKCLKENMDYIRIARFSRVKELPNTFEIYFVKVIRKDDKVQYMFERGGKKKTRQRKGNRGRKIRARKTIKRRK
jgi:hypothetical protein